MTDVQLTNNKAKLNTPGLPADLFDDLSFWISSPSLAFSSWISAEPVASSTRKVRFSMWNKFVRWLDSHDIGLESCREAHIQDFIKEHRLEKEQAWRYVKLIERVYFHLINLGMKIHNPAKIAGSAGVGNRQNDPMRVLSKIEKKQIEKYLVQLFDDTEREGVFEEWKGKNKSDKAQQWAVLRDATVAAVLVGAGMKVHEVVKLSVNCTSIEGVYPVAASAGEALCVNCTLPQFIVFPTKSHGSARKVPLLPIAQRALKVWEPFRKEAHDMGSVLFPALISRRRDDQMKVNAIMHPATLFKRVRALLANAGISGARAAGQTLRNTYAAALIENGATDEILIEALGFRGKFSVQHLRQSYQLVRLTAV